MNNEFIILLESWNLAQVRITGSTEIGELNMRLFQKK